MNLPEPREATTEIINSAIIVAQNLRASGSTHMIGGLEVSLFLVDRAQGKWKNHQPILVFLTDGDPTDGECNLENIINIVSNFF